MENNELKLNEGSIWINQDIKKVLQELYDHYRVVYNRNEYLRKENERLKSEQYKDEELSKMKKEYDKMKDAYYRGFPISEEEDKKIKEWMDKLPDAYTGASGGRFTYKFYPTGLGTSGVIIDNVTKKEFEFQEIG